MRLSSSPSSFEFSLPSDFLPTEIIDKYTPLLSKNFVQYNNVIDYLNSTIKSVTFPGLSYETPEQKLKYGKKRAYRSSIPAGDLFTTHELPVVFRSVDSDLNYMLCMDIFFKHYLDQENIYIKPFILTCVDIWRDAIYTIHFTEIMGVSLSDNTFDYSQQKTNAKEFTLTFKFNFINIEFLLNRTKLLGGTGPDAKILDLDRSDY